MKRALFCSLCVLFLLALAPLSSAETADVEQFLQFEQEPQNVDSNCRCLNFIQQTSEHNGDLPTCPDATAQLYANAYAEASGNCGVDGLCYENLVVTMQCMTNPDNGNQWTKGHMEYRCRVCF